MSRKVVSPSPPTCSPYIRQSSPTREYICIYIYVYIRVHDGCHRSRGRSSPPPRPPILPDFLFRTLWIRILENHESVCWKTFQISMNPYTEKSSRMRICSICIYVWRLKGLQMSRKVVSPSPPTCSPHLSDLLLIFYSSAYRWVIHKVNEPWTRACLGTAAHLCGVFVPKLKTDLYESVFWKIVTNACILFCIEDVCTYTRVRDDFHRRRERLSPPSRPPAPSPPSLITEWWLNDNSYQTVGWVQRAVQKKRAVQKCSVLVSDQASRRVPRGVWDSHFRAKREHIKRI